jgi:hypothetical protein
MTYIWNRAERANGAHNVAKNFNTWISKQKQLFNLTTNQNDRNKIQANINKQTTNYNESIRMLNDSNNNNTTEIKDNS